MKNIFLKETDQKSKLYRNLLTDKLFILEDKVTDVSECNREYQFIYITNNEEIKEGDWVFQECLNMPHRLIKTDTENVKVLNDLNKCKKIVLTNDTSLIEDGVQSIDDEFLEWFVKNPSCEEVEVMNVPDFIYETKHSCYKIIIPKEEPKSLIEKMKTLQEQWQRDMLKTLQEPKQETLEEAIKKYPLINQRIGFKLGVKWQQERSYSEEEVHSILNSFKSLISSGYNKPYFDWFEQFKKK